MNPTVAPPNTVEDDGWSVEGTVTAGAKPRADVTVEAFDRDLRKRQSLGSDVTGPDGRYVIRYRLEHFQLGDRRDGATPRLAVGARADGIATTTVELADEVQRHQTVDLVLRVPSLNEWQHIGDEVAPFLPGQAEDGGTLPPWELQESDVPFLAAETRIDEEQL